MATFLGWKDEAIMITVFIRQMLTGKIKAKWIKKQEVVISDAKITPVAQNWRGDKVRLSSAQK